MINTKMINTITLKTLFCLLEHPNVPDDSNTLSTNGMSLGRGYMFACPMADEEGGIDNTHSFTEN